MRILRLRQLMAHYVYMILCEDGSYYTGCAKNVESRFRRHKKGLGSRYTRVHRPMKVVYVEELRTRREAMHRERTIKSFTHEKKRRLAEAPDV